MSTTTTIRDERSTGGAFFPALAIGAMAAIFIAALRYSPPWQAMWLGAISLFGSMKLLTLATCGEAAEAPTYKRLGYLVLWPGMNPKVFFEPSESGAKPRTGEWLFAISKLLIGATLIYTAIMILPEHLMLGGWLGFVGLVFFFHLGLFHISSLGWRLDGVDVRPIMHWPILATSLSDFWGKRWNRAFRDLMYFWVFRPSTRLFGPVGAMLAAFLVSGFVHEAVITIPARSGFGGPTAYFLLQAAGLLIERSGVGRKLGLGNGIGGRIFCLLFVFAPIGLLFPAAFIRECIVPTLHALAGI